MRQIGFKMTILMVLILAAGPAGADFTIEDFDPAPSADRYGSYPGEDIQPTGYSHSQYGGSNCLRLTGNTWKTLDISHLSIEIQADTVWRVEAYIPSTATVQGFGLYDGSRSLRYAFECGQTAPVGEPWIATLAGSRDTEYGLRTFTLAVGRDWIERYGSTGTIPDLLFFNDEDSQGGQIYFDDIIDVTDSEPKAPQVEAGPDQISQPGQAVNLQAVVVDPDSGSHQVRWNFGDGEIGSGEAVQHTFHQTGQYRVLVTATDPDGLRGLDSLAVTVGDPEPRVATLLIGGDCMLARRYEDANGDGIPGNGDGSLILPGDGGLGAWEIGYSLRRFQVDHRVTNLETTLSTQGYPHPEKQFTFRSRPDAVAGLSAADISLVTLANNHTLDYMDNALSQTLDVLDAPGLYSSYAGNTPILYVGGGANDRKAGYCETLTVEGLRIGVIGFCSVLGRPANQQPFLDAGYDKAGAQLLDRYPLLRGLAEADRAADLQVVLFHAGSEYWTTPSEWAVEMARLAVDHGADLVVCHHPHVLQGIELYQNVPIAYSMGNLIFDQQFAVTKLSSLLRVQFDDLGVCGLTTVPIYLEDYVPRFLEGDAGRNVTAEMIQLSADLGASLVPVEERAHLLLGHEAPTMETRSETLDAPIAYDSSISTRHSPALEVDPGWQIQRIQALPGAPAGTSLLLGRDRMVFGSFEDDDLDQDVDEGVGWDLSGDNADVISHDDPHSREACLQIRRPSPYTSERCVQSTGRHGVTESTTLLSLMGYLRLEDAFQAVAELSWQYFPYGYVMGSTTTMAGPFSGDQPWTRFEGFARAPDNPYESYPGDDPPQIYPQVVLCNDRSSGGTSYSSWDDVRLIEWTEVPVSSLPMDLDCPNGYQYLALKAPSNASSAQVTWTVARWDGPDSDGDELFDWMEDVNGNGTRDRGETDPDLQDSDGDGLDDAEEDRFGLDRYVTRGWTIDSDGDSYSDSDEAGEGTNPTDPDDHPSWPSPTPTPTEPPPPTPTPTPTTGPGTPTYTPTPTGSPDPATLTPTPSGEPTGTFTPEPTPAVVILDLQLDQELYWPGDWFELRCVLINPGDALVVDQYVVLDVGSQYWFWPGWSQEVDSESIFLHQGLQPPQSILAFQWPSGAGDGDGLRFWGALLEPANSALVGLYDWVDFGFREG